MSNAGGFFGSKQYWDVQDESVHSGYFEVLFTDRPFGDAFTASRRFSVSEGACFSHLVSVLQPVSGFSQFDLYYLYSGIIPPGLLSGMLRICKVLFQYFQTFLSEYAGCHPGTVGRVGKYHFTAFAAFFVKNLIQVHIAGSIYQPSRLRPYHSASAFCLQWPDDRRSDASFFFTRRQKAAVPVYDNRKYGRCICIRG